MTWEQWIGREVIERPDDGPPTPCRGAVAGSMTFEERVRNQTPGLEVGPVPTESERKSLHERLQEIQAEEDRKAAEAAERRRRALEHRVAQPTDLRGAPPRMR